MAGAEELSQVGKRTAGVEDVFDDDDVAVLDAAVDILFDLDDARATSRSVPTADLHEFELAFAAHFPKDSGEIAEEVDRALEDSEQDDWLIGGGNAGGDLLGEFAGFEFDVVCRDEFFEPHGRAIGYPLPRSGRHLGNRATGQLGDQAWQQLGD